MEDNGRFQDQHAADAQQAAQQRDEQYRDSRQNQHLPRQEERQQRHRPLGDNAVERRQPDSQAVADAPHHQGLEQDHGHNPPVAHAHRL